MRDNSKPMTNSHPQHSQHPKKSAFDWQEFISLFVVAVLATWVGFNVAVIYGVEGLREAAEAAFNMVKSFDAESAIKGIRP